MYIDVNFILGYVTMGSYVSRLSTHTFATNTVTKEMLVIDELAHVAVGFQLLERSTITINQTISNVCTSTSPRVLF